MPATDREDTIKSARIAATAAGAILSGSFRLETAAADPEHRGLREILEELLPACRALQATFPTVRGRVAGLLYSSVEYRGYTGSSILHIVAQIADLILEAGKSWVGAGELSPKALERLAEELGRALPSSLDDWLRTHLDLELAALERALGGTITDLFHSMERPKFLGKIQRLLGPFMKEPGKVVLARTDPQGSSRPTEVLVEYRDEKAVLVIEGSTTVDIRGERRVWVFRQVHQAAGRTVPWTEIVRADLARAAGLATGQGNESPRMATNASSFQRIGNHIRRALGKLAYHWNQDGHGARWSDDTA